MSIAQSLSESNRMRKWQLFLEQLHPTAEMKVLDVGFTEREFSSVDNFIERHYPYPQNLTALGLAPCREFCQRYPQVRTVTYDGGRFPFADKEFEVCWSNAVLEHVGGLEKQREFVREVMRVSRRAFLTTPNRLFPIEIHTRTPLLHYLPKATFDAYLGSIGKQWATGDYMHLLSERRLRKLLSEAGAEHYRLIRNRLCGFTADFVVVIDTAAETALA